MAFIPDGTDYGRGRGGLAAHPLAFGHILDPQTLKQMLFPNAWQGNRFVLDDFEGDTLNTFLWAVDGDTGPTSFAIPAAGSTVAASIIRGDTSTDDNEGISIYGHATLCGDKNAGMAVRWRSSVVALTYQELGFTDPLSDYTLPAINDIDTPTITNGALTVAVQARDASQTLTSMALILDGDATYATSKVNHGTFTPPWTPGTPPSSRRTATRCFRTSTTPTPLPPRHWCPVASKARWQVLRAARSSSRGFSSATRPLTRRLSISTSSLTGLTGSLKNSRR
ncbi:MAG: hypothetical protein IPI85_16785 [Dehalococcoidia bacterium]|nr:hypothetical protein [Dehalococcoidia bacterium]